MEKYIYIYYVNVLKTLIEAQLRVGIIISVSCLQNWKLQRPLSTIKNVYRSLEGVSAVYLLKDTI